MGKRGRGRGGPQGGPSHQPAPPGEQLPQTGQGGRGGYGRGAGRGEAFGRGQSEATQGGRGGGRGQIPARGILGPAFGAAGGGPQDVRQGPVARGAPPPAGARGAGARQSQDVRQAPRAVPPGAVPPGAVPPTAGRGQGPPAAGRGTWGRGAPAPSQGPVAVPTGPSAGAMPVPSPQFSLATPRAPQSASPAGTGLTSSTASSFVQSETLIGESSSAAAGSSASSESSASKELVMKFTGLELVPQELKLGSFPHRPDRGGNQGRKMPIRANHFRAHLRPDADLCLYDVAIQPEVTSRALNRAIINEVVRLYRESHMGGRLPVYDGMKILYTVLPMPGGPDAPPLVFENVSPQDEVRRGPPTGESQGSDEPEPARRRRTYKVTIKFAARPSRYALAEFLAGRFAEQPQDVLNALDIVLRERLVNSLVPVGRSFFSPAFGRPMPLGGGVRAVRGFFQSLRPSQVGLGMNQSKGVIGLTLNVDMCNTTFVEPKPVHMFVSEFLRRRPGQAFSDADRRQVLKVLRNVRVEAVHQPFRRTYRISDVTRQPTRQLRFDVPDEQTGTTRSVSIMDYFRVKYSYTIQFPDLPCLECGTNPARKNWLPMECCVIKDNQRYSRKLTPDQTSKMLTAAKQHPQEREGDIMRCVQDNNYDQDPYAQEFGIRVEPKMMEINARVLNTPRLKYHDQGRERDCTPRDGAWNMRDKRVVDGGTVRRWACINFAAGRELGRDCVPMNMAVSFCQALARMCNVTGLNMNPQMEMPVQACQPFVGPVEAKLREVVEAARKKVSGSEPPLDFLLCILPTSNTIYGEIKRVAELDGGAGVVTQCMLSKHVEKQSPQYLANLALKINPKVGGRNVFLEDAVSRKIPVVGQEPTILIGADVTHPGAGDDSTPSIAAVVANQDWPQMCTYRGLARTQPSRREIIEELHCEPRRGAGPPAREGMVTELLKAFQQHSRVLPARIIFFRDGVSEGQFDAVRDLEIHAVRKACSAINPAYRPKITFVVVQKRHHTRFFPTSAAGADRSGNVKAGTVVDTDICHPHQYDFFLCSHAGLQGVSRPSKYVVLWDENRIGSNDLQMLINNLTYTYASCTRSVSVVPPAYYAHKLAFRARFWLPPDMSDTDSRRGDSRTGGPPGGDSAGGASSSSRSSRDAQEAQNYALLPDLSEHVKQVMFYC